MAAGPGTAKQIDYRHPEPAHRFIKCPAVQLRVEVGAAESGTFVITVVFIIIHRVIRLGIVKPEGIYPQIKVVLPAFIPDVFPRFRIEHVNFHTVALIVIGLQSAALDTDQQAALQHGIVVLAALIYAWPHRDNNFDAHLMQFVYHSLGIRPVGAVKFPVTLDRPMEKVDHNQVKPDAFLLITSRNFQHLALCAIAQFAQPETHTVFRKFRCTACDSRIILHDFLWRIGRCDPIVHQPGTAGDPFRIVFAECDFPYGRIIPEETVTERGDGEGNTDLTVPLRKLQYVPLEIQIRLLILAHAVEFFVRVTFKFNV